MSAHPQQTNEDSSQENQQEQEPQTYDEKMAGLYQDLSSQNALFQQIIIGLSMGGISYGSEVINAYTFLKENPIDPSKLVTDVKYKRTVERAVKLVKRHEGNNLKTGNSKYSDVIPQTQRAIDRTTSAHNQLAATKELHLKLSYGRNIQTVYDLSDKELAMVKGRAVLRIQKDPTLSMENALMLEARDILRIRDIKEAKEQLKKEGKPTDKKSVIEKAAANRTEREKKFKEASATPHDYESRKIQEILTSCKADVANILGPQSAPTTQPAPSPTSAPQPANPSPMVTPPSTPPLQSIPAGSGLPFRFSLPNISLPHFSLPSLPSLGGLSGGMGLNLGGAIGGGLKNLFGSGGMLSKGLSGLGNLAKGLLPKLASFALPPLGAVLTALSVIDALTGGILSKSAGFVIGGIIIIAVGFPFAMVLFSSNSFSSYTGDNPLAFNTSSKNENNISWMEFEKNFLTQKKANTKDLSWREFEKNYLPLPYNIGIARGIPLLSSLDTDRHDDVQE